MKKILIKAIKSSHYQFNHDNFDMDYFISVSNYHNSCVITKINGDSCKEKKYMSDLPNIINKYSTTEPFSVECDNQGQSFTLILESLCKRSLLQTTFLPLQDFTCPFYRLTDTPIYIFAHESSLYLYNTSVHKIDDIAFDVDDGFYTDNQEHPQVLVIKELNNLYQKFLANNGLKSFRQDEPAFMFPTEKQITEFYKKEFGGLTFNPRSKEESPEVENESNAVLIA